MAEEKSLSALQVHFGGGRSDPLVRVVSVETDIIVLMVELVPSAIVLWSVTAECQTKTISDFKKAWINLGHPSNCSEVLPPPIEGGSPSVKIDGDSIIYSDHFNEIDNGHSVVSLGHIIVVPIERYRAILWTCAEIIQTIAAYPKIVSISPRIVVAVNELRTFVKDSPIVDAVIKSMFKVAEHCRNDGNPIHESVDPLDPAADLLYIMGIVTSATSCVSKAESANINKLVAKAIQAGFGR